MNSSKLLCAWALILALLVTVFALEGFAMTADQLAARLLPEPQRLTLEEGALKTRFCRTSAGSTLW